MTEKYHTTQHDKIEKHFTSLESMTQKQETRISLLEEMVKDIKDVLKSIDTHIERSTEMNYRLDGTIEQLKITNERANENRTLLDKERDKRKELEAYVKRMFFKWGMIVSALSATCTLIGSTVVVKLVDYVMK